MTKSEIAKNYFMQGYNCAQAVFLAFTKDEGLNEETVLKIASSFGGGLGAQREVCGAVSGMCMALGLKRGYSEAKDYAAKQRHYLAVQEICGEFKKQNGSIVCRDLLGLDKNNLPLTSEERTGEYYKKRPCAELVAMAAEILENYFNKKQLT